MIDQSQKQNSFENELPFLFNLGYIGDIFLLRFRFSIEIGPYLFNREISFVSDDAQNAEPFIELKVKEKMPRQTN